MDKDREAAVLAPELAVAKAWQQVGASFERFCLTAGVSALRRMMEQDAVELCGPRYGHKDGKAAHRWGKTQGKIGFHGGKVSLDRPRVRARDGQELMLPSWQATQSEDLLDRWGDEPDADQRLDPEVWPGGAAAGGRYSGQCRPGTSKSAVSRRFVALSAAQTEDRVTAKFDRLAREVSRTSNECVVISHSLYRFIRHQLIYAANLPAPGEDARALGEKRFQAFLDSVAQTMAKGADNDNEPPETDKANEA